MNNEQVKDNGETINPSRKMNWRKIFKTFLGPLIGTFIGGVLTMTTLFIQAWLEDQKRNRLWYEENYIAKGVDSLISSLAVLDFHCVRFVNAAQTFNVPEPELPMEALTRVETLLDDRTLTAEMGTLYFEVHAIMKNKEDVDAIREIYFPKIRELARLLKNLQAALLQQKLKEKRDLYEISRAPEVQRVIQEIKQLQTIGRNH